MRWDLDTNYLTSVTTDRIVRALRWELDTHKLISIIASRKERQLLGFVGLRMHALLD
jgi:hypothetical protein